MNNFRLSKDSTCPLEHAGLTFKEDATIADVLAYIHHYDDEDDILVAAARGATEEIEAFAMLLECDEGSAAIVGGALRRLGERLAVVIALAKQMSLEASKDGPVSGKFRARVAS